METEAVEIQEICPSLNNSVYNIKRMKHIGINLNKQVQNLYTENCKILFLKN